MNTEIKEIYNAIFDQVQELGEIKDTDKMIIERLAFNIYTVQKCELQLLKEGFTVPGAHRPMEHPAVSIKNKAEGKIKESLILLGLDFTSRLKTKGLEPEDNSNDLVLKILRGELA